MSDRKITKHYTKEDVTIVWQPHKCMHSAICFNGLPSAFNPRVRPWINPDGATKEELINQVSKCPSGALSIKNIEPEKNSNMDTNTKITVTSTGPYLIKGMTELTNEAGEVIASKESLALCRCGYSKNKPFCDGSHRNEKEWLDRK